MSNQKYPPFKVWKPVLFSVVLVAGMLIGFNLRDSLRHKRDIETVIIRNDRLEQIIDLISERYVDTIETNLLYKDAVNGILTHMDPHTVYIPAEQLIYVNEEMEGSFCGIGVEFAVLDDTLYVTSVVKNGPAGKAGIQPGDQILLVDGDTVAGVSISSDGIIKKLRGKQYTETRIAFHRIPEDSFFTATIVRDILPLPSIDYSGMLDHQTGYIKINRFSATTYEEFKKALTALIAQGAGELVLDLRSNPGGYLEAATDILDEFISDEKLLVFTQGRKASRKEYKAGKPGMFETGKLIVLIDESSASASEIIAGAIQDWDRGMIIGRRSYGKGLVQEQYDMRDGSAIRLTVARYYTPSGRSIQKAYDKGKAAYQLDLVERYQHGEISGTDSSLVKDTIPYYTNRKRVVYGGGGIIPDVIVGADSSSTNKKFLSFLYDGQLRKALLNYYLIHQKKIAEIQNLEEFKTNFSARAIYEFCESYLRNRAELETRGYWTRPVYQQAIENYLYAEFARMLFRSEGYYPIRMMEDRTLKRALNALDDEAYSGIVEGDVR